MMDPVQCFRLVPSRGGRLDVDGSPQAAISVAEGLAEARECSVAVVELLPSGLRRDVAMVIQKGRGGNG